MKPWAKLLLAGLGLAALSLSAGAAEPHRLKTHVAKNGAAIAKVESNHHNR